MLFFNPKDNARLGVPVSLFHFIFNSTAETQKKSE